MTIIQGDPAVAAPSYSPQFEKATFDKVAWRLIPFLFICYIVAFLDRVNVGFAQLQMAPELQFSDAVYGFGAGVFFIGYSAVSHARLGPGTRRGCAHSAGIAASRFIAKKPAHNRVSLLRESDRAAAGKAVAQLGVVD
jgi:hypothetical protein